MPKRLFNLPTILILLCGFFSPGKIFCASPFLAKCTAALIAQSQNLPSDLVGHKYGGFSTLGGFTTVDTRKLISARVSKALLSEYRKVVPRDNSKTQQSYPVDPKSKLNNPVASFIRAHKDLTLAVLNANGNDWKWDVSSLLLVSQKLQDGFHDHLTASERADPQHTVTRQNAGISIGFAGTVFRSPTDEEEIFFSEAGETSIFNEGALHQSPDGARERLYLLHWFSRGQSDD